jgi:hypothetical protein
MPINWHTAGQLPPGPRHPRQSKAAVPSTHRRSMWSSVQGGDKGGSHACRTILTTSQYCKDQPPPALLSTRRGVSNPNEQKGGPPPTTLKQKPRSLRRLACRAWRSPHLPCPSRAMRSQMNSQMHMGRCEGKQLSPNSVHGVQFHSACSTPGGAIVEEGTGGSGAPPAGPCRWPLCTSQGPHTLGCHGTLGHSQQLLKQGTAHVHVHPCSMPHVLTPTTVHHPPALDPPPAPHKCPSRTVMSRLKRPPAHCWSQPTSGGRRDGQPGET